MRVIYIDTLFLLNFIINYLLLLATAKLTGNIISRWRIAAGGAVGALYAAAVFFPDMQFLTATVIKLAFAGLMCLASFGWRRGLLRVILVFFGASFAFGGCVLAVYLLSGKWFVEIYNGVPYMSVSMRTLLLSAAICYILINLVFKRIAAHGGVKKDIVSTRVSLGGIEIEMPTLMDTGNTLSDPMTNNPVIIAEFDTVRRLLPKQLLPLLEQELLKNPVQAMENLALVDEAHLFRLIPYKAVGVECGMLLAFRPDTVTVGGESKKGALIALSPTKLSDGAAYAALAGV